DVVIADSLKTLAPGASETIKLSVAPAGPSGHAIQTVTWGPTASLGALYPVAAGGALDLTATYAPPAIDTTALTATGAPTGPPLCPAAAAGSVDAKVGAATKTGGGGLPIIAIVIGIVLIAAVVGGVALVAKRMHKSAMRGAGVAL